MAKEATKRATVYFEEDLHRALRLKAAETETSISELVNDAMRESLREDAVDLAAFKERAHEKSVSFETAIKKLKFLGAAIADGQALKGVEKGPSLIRNSRVLDMIRRTEKIEVTDLGDVYTTE